MQAKRISKLFSLLPQLSTRTRRSLQALLAAVFAYNVYLERAGRQHMNWATCSFHAVVFLVRKAVRLIILRLIAIESDHPYWNGLEELIIGTIGFFARLSNVDGVRRIVTPIAKLMRIVHHTAGHLTMTQMDLGLGKNENDAVWMTLKKGEMPTDENMSVILYFHGGGYCFGTADMYAGAHTQLLTLMRDQGVKVGILSIEYPLAPEAKFPEPLEWAIRAYDVVVTKMNICPSRIIIGGDSAGGGLACRSALHAHELSSVRKPMRRLAGLVLISPWVNHSCDSESHKENSHVDYLSGCSQSHDVSKEVMKSFTEAYCEDVHEALTDPHVSLLHMPSLVGLPPIMVTVGKKEVFRDDILLFCEKAMNDKVPVKTHVGESMPHIYHLLWPLFKIESDAALQQVADFCVQRLTA
uniref:Alpha/beta hydrolase fold-3 domain-containing protein n=1 Tax=Aplanochytrium stocchinoi TaxID=215587 RepID=A0A7S3LMA8_9STRA